ncbi:MAG: T4 RnlA family RNA ligase [Sphingobacteriales bacterium JAD_PAG50586_3]|nr:MAG: T4 RnlA family RNA ligase [Sphingobacteriales bacterium JAD_PAG50586_3]
MFEPTLLQEMIEQGYVVVQKHPHANLFIYNYSAKAQYDRVWNDVTLHCRGLILDENQNVVARPFKKFFNLGEHENQVIPNETFEVYEKMDGSLGILYWHNNAPFIATRGSFTSIQSAKANEILNTHYAHLLDGLDKNNTYLFEIIYPENRIVVDYGTTEDLILLSVIDKQTGNDVAIDNWGFKTVKKYDGINDIQALAALEEDNKEGFVICFASGLRYKVKFAEYVRIHRIITQVSTISIWEYLKEGQSLNELIERVPDEFYDWVKKTNAGLLQAFATIEAQAKADFKILETRKETALYFMQCKYPTVLFNMLDGRDYSQAIWKMLRPQYSRPFMNIEE